MSVIARRAWSIEAAPPPAEEAPATAFLSRADEEERRLVTTQSLSVNI